MQITEVCMYSLQLKNGMGEDETPFLPTGHTPMLEEDSSMDIIVLPSIILCVGTYMWRDRLLGVPSISYHHFFPCFFSDIGPIYQLNLSGWFTIAFA
ncbi:hypothetical protein ACJX0J_025160, partial [Zea mays]